MHDLASIFFTSLLTLGVLGIVLIIRHNRRDIMEALQGRRHGPR